MEQPKAGVPAEEVPPKVGSKRGRPPKKSPDNIESSFKRLSKAYCLTFIELDDQTHLSPAVGNLPTIPHSHSLPLPKPGMQLVTPVHQGPAPFLTSDSTAISARSRVRDPKPSAGLQNVIKSPQSPRERSPQATCTTNNTTQVSYSGKATKEELEPKDSGPQRKPKVQRSKSAGNSRFALLVKKVEQSDPEYLRANNDMLQILEEFF